MVTEKLLENLNKTIDSNIELWVQALDNKIKREELRQLLLEVHPNILSEEDSYLVLDKLLAKCHFELKLKNVDDYANIVKEYGY